MISYEPEKIPLTNLRKEPQSDELADIFEGMLRINAHEPRRMQAFFAACKRLNLEAADGLGRALLLFKPTMEPEQGEEANTTPTEDVSLREIFIACRQVMGSSGAVEQWNRLSPTYHDLCLALKQETLRLNVGDDPREPW